MITLIVGQNAIGKTVYLKNKVREEAKKSEVLCNIVDKSYLSNLKYNEERLEELEDVFDADNIIKDKYRLTVDTSVMQLHPEMQDLLTLICKEAKKLYLDDPELSLSYREIARLVMFLAHIEHTFDEIVIATHSELFLQLPNIGIKTIKYDTLLKDFVVVDIDESAYKTMD